MSKLRRAFYRCRTCCHVCAIHQTDSKTMADLRCACEGAMELMGFVTGNRLLREEDRCPCDERCTHARGPKCDCVCGGENHGTQAVVTVTVSAGGVPMIAVLDTAEIRRRAAEYRDARAPLLARRDALEAQRSASGWLDGPYFNELCAINRTLSYAHGLKTHKARIKALSKEIA